MNNQIEENKNEFSEEVEFSFELEDLEEETIDDKIYNAFSALQEGVNYTSKKFDEFTSKEKIQNELENLERYTYKTINRKKEQIASYIKEKTIEEAINDFKMKASELTIVVCDKLTDFLKEKK